MTYSIAQVAEITGLTAHTLRYYDKEGLLPYVARSAAGVRQFEDADLAWLTVISCLKKTGMPIKQIKQYIDWSKEGDATLQQRLDVMIEHKQTVLARMQELEQYLEMIDHKIDYYTTALNAGTEQVHAEQPKYIRFA